MVRTNSCHQLASLSHQRIAIFAPYKKTYRNAATQLCRGTKTIDLFHTPRTSLMSRRTKVGALLHDTNGRRLIQPPIEVRNARNKVPATKSLTKARTLFKVRRPTKGRRIFPILSTSCATLSFP